MSAALCALQQIFESGRQNTGRYGCDRTCRGPATAKPAGYLYQQVCHWPEAMVARRQQSGQILCVLRAEQQKSIFFKLSL